MPFKKRKGDIKIMSNTYFGWRVYAFAIPVLFFSILIMAGMISFIFHETFILIGCNKDKPDKTEKAKVIEITPANSYDQVTVVLENEKHRFIAENKHLSDSVVLGQECTIFLREGYSRFRFIGIKFHIRDMVVEIDKFHVFKKVSIINKI